MNETLPLVPIPENLLPNKNMVDSYRTLVAAALKNDSAPACVNTQGLERKTLFIPPVLHAKISEAAMQAGMSFQETFCGLAQAGIEIVQKTRVKMVSSALAIDVPFKNPRPGQDRFYRAVMASLDAGRICMAEASTGIGKSRALVAAALVKAPQFRRKKLGPIVIAAPTLSVLGGSLWAEYESLMEDWPNKKLKVRFFPGSTEFVDRRKLTEWLDSAASLGEPVDKKVSEWTQAGAPVVDDTPLMRAMAQSGRPLGWLAHDLRGLAENMDPSEFTYRGGDEDAETAALIAEIREDACDADVIFCTHAMLGRAYQSGWAWFPKPAALILDEAHAFEHVIAGINSYRVSLYSLRHRMRLLRRDQGTSKKSTAGRGEEIVTRLIGETRKFAEQNPGTSFIVNHESSGLSEFLNIAAELNRVLSSKPMAELSKRDEAKSALSEMLRIISPETDQSRGGLVYIEFSPDRRFPSILAGAVSVSGLLGGLWNQIEGGIVLASATLYTPDEFGNPKCDYLASLLAAPVSRLDTPSPVIAPWVTAIPVLHVPTPSEAVKLIRPQSEKRNETTEAEWLSNLSKRIHKIVSATKGGTLVLCTSYAQVTTINNSLAKLGVGKSRLIAHSPNQKFAITEQSFRDAHAQGLRPVLIATGTAWTGIDLTDKSVAPDKDTLLTDLVIACLPVGINRTSTMQTRIEKMGTYPIIKEALMILRQGMGRLIRSSEARNKNLWILDGRIWSDWPRMESLQKSVRYLLRQYKTQKSE